MTRSIGEPVRYDLLDRARIAHRPTDQAGLRAAALDLKHAGLTHGDIAQALQIGEAAVEQLLSEASDA